MTPTPAPKPNVSELRRLLAEASQRPWRAGGNRVESFDACESGSGARFTRIPFTVAIGKSEESDQNAALIVAAINALPALLDRLEQLEAAARKAVELAECAGSAPRAEIARVLESALTAGKQGA